MQIYELIFYPSVALSGALVALLVTWYKQLRSHWTYRVSLCGLSGVVAFGGSVLGRWWLGDSLLAYLGAGIIGVFLAIGSKSNIDRLIEANEKLGEIFVFAISSAARSFATRWLGTTFEDEEDREEGDRNHG